MMMMMSPIVRFVFASAGTALAVGTAADFCGTKHLGSFFCCSEVLLPCFSLKRNVAALMSTKSGARTTAEREFFGFFNGMRFAPLL